MKYYKNVRDYQGGSWAMYCQSIADWRKTAMCWCDSDENWELYNALKYYKIKNADLIDYINDIWSIKLVPASKELYLKYKNVYDIEDYEDDYWECEEDD